LFTNINKGEKGMDILQKPKKEILLVERTVNFTEEAGLDWLRERYPDSMISGQFRGSGYCIFVNGELAMKPAKFYDLPYKLCNEFNHEWIEEKTN
jgi:hypothetical protein